MTYDPREQQILLSVFTRMLTQVTADGAKKRALADPGFSNYVRMVAPVGTTKTEDLRAAPNVSLPDFYKVIIHDAQASLYSALFTPVVR